MSGPLLDANGRPVNERTPWFPLEFTMRSAASGEKVKISLMPDGSVECDDIGVFTGMMGKMTMKDAPPFVAVNIGILTALRIAEERIEALEQVVARILSAIMETRDANNLPDEHEQPVASESEGDAGGEVLVESVPGA
jgi:hypothetical protein